jgi:ABC-type transporter Mla MlaB component
MVTKSPTNALLSKFGQLFRRSDDEDTPREQPSKRSGPDAVKLKRRNDKVRDNEFNQLRRVIQNNRGIRPMEALDVASFASTNARNSGLGALERNSLINKIDKTEAHLDQWWGPGSARTPLTSQTPPAEPLPDSEDLDLDFTDMMELEADSATMPSVQAEPVVEYGSDQTAAERAMCDSALLYAAGEFQAAEELLVAQLAANDLDSATAEDLCFALFDVYRCAGQHERFEALAVNYATRFGRSPAEWFSVAQSEPKTPDQQAQAVFWRCPAVLDASAMADLLARLSDTDTACAINWMAVQQIDMQVQQTLAAQIKKWSQRPVTLQWLGTGALMAALDTAKSTCFLAESETWWLIQLDLLCMSQSMQAFEDLALEYCVRFEVSPPCWTPVACRLGNASATPTQSALAASAQPESSVAGALPQAQYCVYELNGNVTGDNPTALNKLREMAQSAKTVTLSCARLGRIDLQASQALLTWAQERHEQCCETHFKLLPRLVWVYFYMLGMDQWASLSTGSH